MSDNLLGQARAAGLNISQLASKAVAEELDRRAKIAEIDAYLADLEAGLGPVSEEDLAEARSWVARLSATSDPARSESGAA